MALPIYLRVGNNGPRRSVGTKVTFTGMDQIGVVSSFASASEFDTRQGIYSTNLKASLTRGFFLSLVSFYLVKSYTQFISISSLMRLHNVQ